MARDAAPPVLTVDADAPDDERAAVADGLRASASALSHQLEGRPSSPGRRRTKPPKLNPGYGDESWLLRRLQDYDIALAAIRAAAAES